MAHVFVDDLVTPQLSIDDEHHLRSVLRVRPNESVSVTNGHGQWRLCTFNGEVLQPTTDVVSERARGRSLSVALVPVKGDRTEWSVEKLVELGIDEIVIVEPTEHSVVRWNAEKTAANIERLRKIARAAAMQSRQVWCPRIGGAVSFGDLVRSPGVAIAEPTGGSLDASVATVVIGPEGGFSRSEVDRAQAAVTLGDSVLRADTAAVVAATLMVTLRAASSDHTWSS